MKLFTLKDEKGSIKIIHPDSIIVITPVKNDVWTGSDVHLRHAMVTHGYDTRTPEELAKQINRECYNINEL